MLVLYLGLTFSLTGCYVTGKKDNGNHKGWFKNTNNPHNPKSKKDKNKSHSSQKSNQSYYLQRSNEITGPDCSNQKVAE